MNTITKKLDVLISLLQGRTGSDEGTSTKYIRRNVYTGLGAYVCSNFFKGIFSPTLSTQKK